MAKNKLGKFLAFTAVIGAAIAAGTAFFMKQKKKHESLNLNEEDFEDDLDDDFDFPASEEEETVQREYVSLNRDTIKKENETAPKEQEQTAAESTEQAATSLAEEEEVKTE